MLIIIIVIIFFFFFFIRFSIFNYLFNVTVLRIKKNNVFMALIFFVKLCEKRILIRIEFKFIRVFIVSTLVSQI